MVWKNDEGVWSPDHIGDPPLRTIFDAHELMVFHLVAVLVLADTIVDLASEEQDTWYGT